MRTGPPGYPVVVLTSSDRRPVSAHRSKQSGSYNIERRSGEFVVFEDLFGVAAAEENQAYFLERSVLLKKFSDSG
jgi:hypothetical protein